MNEEDPSKYTYDRFTSHFTDLGKLAMYGTIGDEEEAQSAETSPSQLAIACTTSFYNSSTITTDQLGVFETPYDWEQFKKRLCVPEGIEEITDPSAFFYHLLSIYQPVEGQLYNTISYIICYFIRFCPDEIAVEIKKIGKSNLGVASAIELYITYISKVPEPDDYSVITTLANKYVITGTSALLRAEIAPENPQELVARLISTKESSAVDPLIALGITPRDAYIELGVSTFATELIQSENSTDIIKGFKMLSYIFEEVVATTDVITATLISLSTGKYNTKHAALKFLAGIINEQPRQVVEALYSEGLLDYCVDVVESSYDTDPVISAYSLIIIYEILTDVPGTVSEIDNDIVTPLFALAGNSNEEIAEIAQSFIEAVGATEVKEEIDGKIPYKPSYKLKN